MKLYFIGLLAFLTACGGKEPLCQDSSAESAFMHGCTGTGAPNGYCGCAFNYLADRYRCADFGNITINVAQETCRACGGGGGCQ
jgi:hypothetical protein